MFAQVGKGLSLTCMNNPGQSKRWKKKQNGQRTSWKIAVFLKSYDFYHNNVFMEKKDAHSKKNILLFIKLFCTGYTWIALIFACHAELMFPISHSVRSVSSIDLVPLLDSPWPYYKINVQKVEEKNPAFFHLGFLHYQGSNSLVRFREIN